MKFTIGSAFKISKILPLFRNLKLISGDVKFTLSSEGLKIQETDGHVLIVFSYQKNGSVLTIKAKRTMTKYLELIRKF